MKHYPAFFRLAPFLLLLAGIGCNDKLPVEPIGSVIMPLAKGNMWIGTLTTYYEGSIISTEQDTIMVKDEMTIYVKSDKPGVQDLEPQTWYLCDDLETGGEIWYRNSEDGLRSTTGSGLARMKDEQDGCQCSDFPMRYPAKVTDTSGTLPIIKVLIPNPDDTSNPTVLDQITARYVQNVDTTITVPLGTYDVNVYHLKILTPETAMFVGTVPWQYMAPDVGPVQIVWYKDGANRPFRVEKRWVLTELKLN